MKLSTILRNLAAASALFGAAALLVTFAVYIAVRWFN